MIKSLKINKSLEQYISKNSYDLHPVQKEIIKYNEKLGRIKKMQISVTQGYFFQFFIKTSNIKKILEVGTFTGYSSITMGLALPNTGSVTCLDINKITTETALKFIKKANLQKKINVILGPAFNSLKKFIKSNEKFDLIFIDADKENYLNYYETCLELINKKGLIVIDNVLWHGEVIDDTKNDKFTNIIREFNTYIKEDGRVVKNIIPIGDGLTICIKK